MNLEYIPKWNELNPPTKLQKNLKNANGEERFWRKSEKFNEKRDLAQKNKGEFVKIVQERTDVQIESAKN